MDRSPSPGQPSSAESIFAAWLAKRDDEFEALVRANKQHERELRELHVFWMRIEPLLRLAGIDDAPASFSERLKAAHGEVDPQVTLDEPGAKATSDLVRRLATKRAPGSRYTLEGEIARGGMGAILRVWDEDIRRHLAMKVVLGRGDAGASGDTPAVEEQQLARFLEEAQVTGQLDHPGIVPVHELGLDQDGRVYFTMKLVKGRDLKAIFDLVFGDKESWNETRALSVILKACEAMAYAHTKGVIHRDLKPANIMVGNFGEVYVMDWGLARVLGKKDAHDIRIKPEFATGLTSVKSERREEREATPDSPIVTMDGDVMGTPAYMSPEQARGEIEKLSARSDVYALGAMLYHLLAREMPYVRPGMRATNRSVLAMVLQGPPAPLAALRKEVPAELVAICEKAMSRDAAKRYADTLGLAADLRAYLEHRVVGAYEGGTWAETRKWVQRNKPLAASLAAAVVLLIGGIVTSMTFATRATEKADALARANTTIQTKHAALAVAMKTAEENEQLATEKANDVLSLSAIQDLKDLEDRADALWPAGPENVPKYEAWLGDARVLIDGRAGDPGRGIKSKASVAEHETKLAAIRGRAKPLTPEQIEVDRRASPSFAEWEKARAQLQWMRRMLGEEPWPSEAEIDAALTQETLPADANGLNSLAWPLVDADSAKIVYGSEVKALVLAQRAVLAATDAERAEIRDTLGWALYRCGRFEAALVEEQRAVDDAKDQQKQELAASLKQLQDQVALWTTSAAHAKQAGEASKLPARVAELERGVNERRTFEFEDSEDRWWQAQLSKLVSDLKAFADEKSGGLLSSGTSEKHGWGILARAEFARTIEERSVSGAEAKQRWDEALAVIAKSPKYGGLKLTPQLGLLPIGEDPDSHLWEFAHLQTGEPAQRGADGKLVLKEELSLVFVLIPGGKFWMGAQSTDPTAQNYDPQAIADESPVHEVTLSPHFLSKFEMTQGQWERFTGHNPSGYGPLSKINGHQHDLTHPVEQVTWTQCMEVMSRLGLELPSEAQWESGCRGGQDTPWWTGAERESLRGKVNVADQAAAKAGATWEGIKDWPDLEDGWAVHAPVGSLPANPYGLREVHGNVWEWCRDGYGYYSATNQRDPITPWIGAQNRVIRGGSFFDAASRARSACRANNTPDVRVSSLGLRPAKAVRP